MPLATTSVSGLISGMDTASIIQQLMSIERRPIILLQDQINKAEAQKAAFGAINTSLLALKTSVDELSRDTTWLAKSVSVSDESVVGATASSETPSGVYTFSVGQLAEATQLSSNGYADSDTALVGSGQFDLTAAGVTETVTVSATDTLDDVAADINGRNLAVSAIVVNTGTDYRLILTSDDTGLVNSTSISANTSGMLFSEITVAKNAQVQFGSDSPINIESATNTVTGLAPGLTLDLKAVSASPVTVTVASDTAGILEKAKDFAAKYGAVQTNIDKYTEYDEEGERAAVLFANSTLRFISTDLARAVGNRVDGVIAETNSLTMVGFEMGSDGKLTLDEDAFTAALEAHPDGVADLFSGVLDGALTSAGAAMAASPAAAGGFNADDIMNGNTDPGDFGAGNGFQSANTIAADGGQHVFTIDFGTTRQIKQLFINTFGDGTGIMDFTVELERPAGGYDLVSTETGFSGAIWAELLTDPMTATGMRITVTAANAGAGDLTRILEVRAQEEGGVAHVLSNQLNFITRGMDGQIANEQDSLDQRIRNMEDHIADLEERLISKEERLRADFIAMESALAQMQSQSSFFLTQLAAMPKTSQ